MMHWAAAYLGRPWRVGASGPSHFDCWGLVLAVYRDRLGLELPPAGFTSEDAKVVLAGFRDHPERARWRQVDAPADLDAVLMAQARQPIHVGIHLEEHGGRVLHATRAAGVVAQDRVSLGAQGYQIVGFYRHASRA